jgi:hypothetical protein
LTLTETTATINTAIITTTMISMVAIAGTRQTVMIRTMDTTAMTAHTILIVHITITIRTTTMMIHTTITTVITMKIHTSHPTTPTMTCSGVITGSSGTGLHK